MGLSPTSPTKLGTVAQLIEQRKDASCLFLLFLCTKARCCLFSTVNWAANASAGKRCLCRQISRVTWFSSRTFAGASPTRGAIYCRILKLVNEDRLWGVRSSVGPRTVDPMRRVQLSYTPPKSVAFGLRWFESSSYNQPHSNRSSSQPSQG